MNVISPTEEDRKKYRKAFKCAGPSHLRQQCAGDILIDIFASPGEFIAQTQQP